MRDANVLILDTTDQPLCVSCIYAMYSAACVVRVSWDGDPNRQDVLREPPGRPMIARAAELRRAGNLIQIDGMPESNVFAEAIYAGESVCIAHTLTLREQQTRRRCRC